MTARETLDLDVLLAPDAGDHDVCASRLAALVGGAPGVTEAHVVRSPGPARLCVHFDPDETNLARIRSLAEASGAALAARYGHAVWAVDGITHARRARAVSAALTATPGVLEAEATVAGLVRVEWDRTVVDESTLLRVLATEHTDPIPVGRDHDHRGQDHHVHRHTQHAPRELATAIAAGALLVVAQLAIRVLGAGHDDPTARALTVAAFGLAGVTVAREVLENARRRRVEIDSLMLVAAVGAAALGEWAEGALLLVLFSLGHALEGQALGRARHAIEALGELAPDTARVVTPGGVLDVAVDDVAVGDVVLVRPGERFPTDGVVVRGSTTVDQAPVTGESIPVEKRPMTERDDASPTDLDDPSSRIFAGSLNGDGAVEVRVTRRSTDSTLARVAALVAEAETEAAPTQRLTERFERRFVPVVVGSAVLVAVVGPLVLDWSWRTGSYRALALLVAASPCALAVATPAAVLSGIARAARQRVLVKGGAALEHLGTITTLAFDKTGTLTEGRPTVTDVVPASGVSEGELLAVTIAVERRSDHPLARAVVAVPPDRYAGWTVPDALGVVAVPGQGVRATIDTSAVAVGSSALFGDDGPPLPPALADVIDRLVAGGRTVVVTRLGERYLGVLGLRDEPRAGAADIVRTLRHGGMSTIVMLSGDAPEVAGTVAADLALDGALGGLLPDQKVAAVRELQRRHGPLAMVGDGVNDAPALAGSTVGIAMGAAGSDVALETADVALMADDLSGLPFVIALGRATRRTILQNLGMAMAVVAVLVPATVAGLAIGPAVVAHEGSTLVIVANALRLLRFDPKTTGAA